MPKPVSRLELILPKPWTSAIAQVHGPLSTEALKPSWVRSSVADCSASGTSIAVRLWSTETPTLTPGATRAPSPATPPQVWRWSPTKSPCAPVRGRDSVGLAPGPETAAHRSLPRRRRRPDCSAARCRNRRSPGFRGAPGNCCRDWPRPQPADSSELISRRRGVGAEAAAGAATGVWSRWWRRRRSEHDGRARQGDKRSQQPLQACRPSRSACSRRPR